MRAPAPAVAASTSTPTLLARGRGSFLVRLVSGLRGLDAREAEIARLEREGWRVASAVDPRYRSLWMEKEDVSV